MIVAIIPARGGSKRIPRKNIQQFCGKPLIAYSILAAQRSGLFGRIIVSTDSEEIAKIAQAWGAEVPFRRPAELSNDYASTAEVLEHAVTWLQQNGGCEAFCCIYATAPLIDEKYILKGYELMIAENADSVMSVTTFSFPVERALNLNANGQIIFQWPGNAQKRSQDLPEVFYDAGQFYWCQAHAFMAKPDIFALNPLPIILPLSISQDINTQEDWEMAELKHLRQQRKTNVHDIAPETTRIVLGTAQLGFTYGIANRSGKPNAAVANSMLCAAWAGGLRIFDTAQAYGDSEYVLGEFFDGSYGFTDARFITKLHPDVDVNCPDAIRCHIEESLRRLCIPRIWLLLLHSEEHLLQWSGILGQTLRQLRDEGLIANLGASVYGVDFALQAVRNPDFTYVAVAGGVFDRRIKRGGVAQLAEEYNKKLIIRSVFLQGLVFMDPERIPYTIPHARDAVLTLRRFCTERGIDAHAFAYQYVRESFPEALIVLGAETQEQVIENCRLDMLDGLDPGLLDAWDEAWTTDFEGLYNPSSWETTNSGNLWQF
ncbi:MAG: pseudaminic acid cytidylyltransferase [Verrucomicrobiota bacterium]